MHSRAKSNTASSHISASVKQGAVIQRMELNLKVPNSNNIWTVDTRETESEIIRSWIDESIETQPKEVHEFIRQLSGSQNLNPQENFLLKYATAGLKSAQEAKIRLLECSMLQIAGDEKNYPYGGFLTKYSGLNRKMPEDSPLVKTIGISKRGFKPGMNCWGAILFAAFQAKLISRKEMLDLDRKGEDGQAELLKLPHETICKTIEELKLYPFIRGCIISLAENIEFVHNIPGKHVFLSMGGTGLTSKIIEVDSGRRGINTLEGVLREYHLLEKDSITLFIYKPEWLDF